MPPTALESADLRQIAREAFTAAANDVASYSLASYLNRQRMACWLSISPAYLDKLVRLGAPVTEIDGHRMYQKAAFTRWLEKYQH